MARPLKTDEERRDFMLRIRVNASEKTRIEQNAANAGQEPSVFLRSLGTNTKPTRTVPTPDREILLKFLAEESKQGSNLNQIARALNRKQDSFDYVGIDIAQFNRTMQELEQLKLQLMAFLAK